MQENSDIIKNKKESREKSRSLEFRRSVQNWWDWFLKLVAPDFPDLSRKPQEPELRKF